MNVNPVVHTNPMELPVIFHHVTEVQSMRGKRCRGFSTWEASHEGRRIAVNQDLAHLRQLFPNGKTEEEHKRAANEALMSVVHTTSLLMADDSWHEDFDEAAREGQYLSMPDPCPHVSRMDVIYAKLHGEPIPTCPVNSGAGCSN